jgi:hypothetical protein
MTPPKRFIFCKPYKDCVPGEIHWITADLKTYRLLPTENIKYKNNTGKTIIDAVWDLDTLKELLDLKIIIPY